MLTGDSAVPENQSIGSVIHVECSRFACSKTAQDSVHFRVLLNVVILMISIVSDSRNRSVSKLVRDTNEGTRHCWFDPVEKLAQTSTLLLFTIAATIFFVILLFYYCRRRYVAKNAQIRGRIYKLC